MYHCYTKQDMKSYNYLIFLMIERLTQGKWCINLSLCLPAHVRLSNTRDTITLLDVANSIIDQVVYEKKQIPREGYTMLF